MYICMCVSDFRSRGRSESPGKQLYSPPMPSARRNLMNCPSDREFDVHRGISTMPRVGRKRAGGRRENAPGTERSPIVAGETRLTR